MLVNAAGFTKLVPHADLDALDDDLIDMMFAVNWRGQFAAVRTFAPLLKASGNGLIVSISSIAGTNGIGSSIATPRIPRIPAQHHYLPLPCAQSTLRRTDCRLTDRRLILRRGLSGRVLLS